MSTTSSSASQIRFEVHDYDLAATLSSGQAFRWNLRDEYWESVIHGHWVRLLSTEKEILAETAEPIENWSWLANYLQFGLNFKNILATFPDDEPMRAAVSSCCGLRLLRQDPWECLASFILSSTKQIVQIEQIVGSLCERFGEPVPVPPGRPPAYSFPTAARLAECSEADLRACKMGFRAAYLKNSAAMIAASEVSLANLLGLDLEQARQELLKLPGVGRKIADCVLLFAYGFPKAFPIDVWVMKALCKLYFRGRRIPLQRLQRFSEDHFGPFAGFAQQYLFHYMRKQQKRTTVKMLPNALSVPETGLSRDDSSSP